MNQAGPNPYLKTKIMTANAEELRLLLFDGAIKFCNQAKFSIEKKQFEESYSNIVKAQKIVLELSSSLNHKIEPEVTEKMASLYDYIHRRLVDANMSRHVEDINEAIRLLQYERDTWVMLVKKVKGKEARQQAVAPSTPITGYGQMTGVRQNAMSTYSQSA